MTFYEKKGQILRGIKLPNLIGTFSDAPKVESSFAVEQIF